MAGQALLLLPALFPNPPADPLLAITAPPTRTEDAFPYPGGSVVVDVYRPAGSGSFGGALLLLGARPVPRRDATLVRFAEALAREGVVVLIPESSGLLEGRVLPDELEALRMSFELLLAQPGVDPARVGLLGFSVGGSLSIVAAAQPALRDRVRFVNALGAYYDAAALVVDVLSRSIVLDGQVERWEPSPLAHQVVTSQVIQTLPDESDRALLERAYLGGEPLGAADVAALSPAGELARALLDGGPRDVVAATLARLPAESQARLRAISPSAVLADVRADLYLMHDTGDAYIPFTESRQLVAAAPPGLVQRYTEFSIFQHVIPDRPVPWQTFLPDLWKLFWHVQGVFMELL